MADEEMFENAAPVKNRQSFNDTIPGLDESSDKFKINKKLLIEFGLSNEEADAGQSFVPYFDGSDITFDVKSPLSGLGLFHYTRHSDYAGYIRPTLQSLNYENFIFDLKENDPTLKTSASLIGIKPALTESTSGGESVSFLKIHFILTFTLICLA